MGIKEARSSSRVKILGTVAALAAVAALAGCTPIDDPPSTTSTTTTSTTSTTSTTIPAGSTTLSVTGHLEYFGVAQVGQRQIRVRTYGTSGETIPGGFLITVNAAAPHGNFSTVIPLGDDVRGVNLIAELETPDGTAYFPSFSYNVVTDQANTAVYNTHGSFVRLDTTFLKDGAPYTEPFEASIQVYDADDDQYGYGYVTPVYPNPWGTEVSLYVPYESFAGGNSSTDPTRVELDFFGFEDPDDRVSYNVELDRGAAFYMESPTLIIEHDPGDAE